MIQTYNSTIVRMYKLVKNDLNKGFIKDNDNTIQFISPFIHGSNYIIYFKTKVGKVEKNMSEANNSV